MYWCPHCQEFVEPLYDNLVGFPSGPRCPSCRGLDLDRSQVQVQIGVSGADNGRSDLTAVKPSEPADGFAVNAGNWNVTDFGWVIGACHTPEFDALMTRLRLLERAVQEDEPRVRRLPRPWLGDPHHNQLKHERDAVRNRAKAYLLAHRSLIILDSR